jgi:hypothetical protein
VVPKSSLKGRKNWKKRNGKNETNVNKNLLKVNIRQETGLKKKFNARARLVG